MAVGFGPLEGVPTSSGFAVVRLNPNGSLYTSFGGNGRVTTAFFRNPFFVPGEEGFSEFLGSDATAVAIQPEGKIVVAGFSGIVLAPSTIGSGLALVRYNPDGSLDTSFGSGGKVTTDLTGLGDFSIGQTIFQPDGKIVMAGSVTTGFPFPRPFDFLLVRYNPGGSLDTSFGSGGKVITDLGGNRESADALALQTDGKIVAVGEFVVVGGEARVSLWRATSGISTPS